MDERTEYLKNCKEKVNSFINKPEKFMEVYEFINDAINYEKNYVFSIGKKDTFLLFNLKETQSKQLAVCYEKYKKKKSFDKDFDILISNLMLDFVDE